MPQSELRTPVVVYCDIKAPIPQARVLIVEKLQILHAGLKPLDTLVIPEDPDGVVTRSKTDRFFLDLQEARGFQFVDREIISANKEWLRVADFLAGSPLIDLRKLLAVIFPTLIARELADYEKAFALERKLTPPQAMARLATIAESRAATVPGRTIRTLKQIFHALPKQYADWLDALPTKEASEPFSSDQDYFVDLDRFENLTAGVDLTAGDIRELLGGSSLLAEKIPGYEIRKGQAKYAETILKGMEENQIVMVEAATGTGKSIGYLLPAIARCNEEEARAVIVTRTKSLQEQLFRSDLQKIKAIVPTGMKISVLKGLANYLCLLKYKHFISDLTLASGAMTPEHLAALVVWEAETKSGDLTETGIFDQPGSESLLSAVTLDEATCLGKNCAFFTDCYAFRARKNAVKSSVVITNYALLFADLLADGSILGKFTHAIFDEAHRLEAETVSAFTDNLPLLGFARALERVASDRFAKSLSDCFGNSDTIAALAVAVRALAPQLVDQPRVLAVEAARLLRPSGKEPGERIRFKTGQPLHETVSNLWKSHEAQFDDLRRALAALQQSTISAEREESGWELVVELKKQMAAACHCINVLEAIAGAADERVVMWGQAYDSNEVAITVAPLAVGELLFDRLYSRYESVTLTSATLDSEDGFQWISSRLGLTADKERIPTRLKIRSPFPLAEQLKIALARYLPPPSSEQYTLRLGELIKKLRTSIRLPTLVLCTSYRMIEALTKALRSDKRLAADLLIQTPESVPQILLSRFRQMPAPLLIGTESFWEGIDLPGRFLRLLIMTRLPFPVPDDPLELAKQEQAEARGENPFMAVSLPTAVLKFRQGIGRLIRNSSDWGAVVVTDSRMGTKNYGRIFFDAASAPVESHDHESQLIKDVGQWLREMGGI
jgi:ATP-dependent DNA helicase DinG